MRPGLSGASSSARWSPACPCARPRPAVPLSGVSVKHSVQKCACVVLVHCHANVLVSVHAGVCVRVVGAGSCGHAAHGLSDAPAPAGRGSPRGESQRARRRPRAATA